MREGFRAGPAVCAVAPAVAALAHIGPAATWLPGLRRWRFPGLAGLGRPDHVALTFDDGPGPVSTPHFLDVLDGLGVRATFFVLGENVVRHRAQARELARRGHEIAVHGWTHDRPWLPSPARDARELARTVRAVREVTGQAPLWYRPPYGILTSGRWAAARRAGLRPVLWTAWGKDWRRDATSASVRATVAADLRGGGTVLLHDTDHASAPGSWRAALAALPGIVRDCREAGLEVGPLLEHGTAGAAGHREAGRRVPGTPGTAPFRSPAPGQP
ncbi:MULTISPECIES: polysaccharide deacetylase family protein [unclassified Streptomyces]|uniref:polysaccharide deacetylase family protein n=1 Tax=unclassified Streptomyces TaxID=2593676 RepID=UPI00234BFDE6|nr:polysaccharide deacetylase family protein [Streptomyces sp. M92]WCN05938.1 polysaccharide deacetylase family protein [Streptomyces sp. M92]